LLGSTAHADDGCRALFETASPALSGRCDLDAAIAGFDQSLPGTCAVDAAWSKVRESLARLAQIAKSPSGQCGTERALLAAYALCRLDLSADPARAPERIRPACTRAHDLLARDSREGRAAWRRTLKRKVGLSGLSIALLGAQLTLAAIFRETPVAAEVMTMLAGLSGGALLGGALGDSIGRWGPVAAIMLAPIFGVAGGTGGWFAGASSPTTAAVTSGICTGVGIAAALVLVWTS
jgi:hypothetical protein